VFTKLSHNLNFSKTILSVRCPNLWL
jgi:hypothetical protein